jgi:hypothetical protein
VGPGNASEADYGLIGLAFLVAVLVIVVVVYVVALMLGKRRP